MLGCDVIWPTPKGKLRRGELVGMMACGGHLVWVQVRHDDVITKIRDPKWVTRID